MRTFPVVFPVVMYGCESWIVKIAEPRDNKQEGVFEPTIVKS